MGTFKERWGRVPQWLKIVVYTILGAGGMVLLGLLFGYLIQWLWNSLMPALFGLTEITFWQAVGLFVLAKFLFGFGGSSGGEDKSHKKHKRERDCMKEDWPNWRHYDEWWEKEGKTAFQAYAGKKNEPGNGGDRSE